MDKKLQELRQAIIRAVPDIKRLEFGCEVIVEFENGETGPAAIVEEMVGPSFLVKWEFGTQDIEHHHLIKILGRPIRLSMEKAGSRVPAAALDPSWDQGGE